MRGRKPTGAQTRAARGETRRDRDLPVLIAGREAPPMPVDFLDDPKALKRVRDARARQRDIWTEATTYLAGAGVLDKADGAVLRALVVQIWIHEEANKTLQLSPTGLLTTNSQGVVAHPALAIIDRAGKEIRQLSDELPLSPWGRQRLNLHGTAPAGQDIDATLGPARLSVVGGHG